MRIEPQAASRLEAMPVALIAQSVTVLAQNAESLRRTIDAFVLGNPLLEYAPAGPNPAEALDIAELAVARRATLAEHLGMQLRIAERDPEVLRIGRMIIESLDKYGYLREHTEDMLRASHASPAAFARALAAVQALEPCGVAARSLGECLALQLRARTAPEPLALEIVTGHLEEMAAGTLRLPGHAAEEIEAACRLIRSLNPRPGAAFDQDVIHYIVPDVRIARGESGRLCASLINQPAPPAIAPQYMEYLKAEDEPQRQYVRDNLMQARSFLFALKERAETLLAIASLAVAVQEEYLTAREPGALRPLTMTAAARKTGLSLSTVSRTVNGKYAEFEGHEVTEAENGMEAVRLFRRTPDAFDIVIMDVMMPELDGFSAVAEIKKIASPAVIMLSARGEEYDKIHGFELGVDDYVVKPFSPKELMMRVAAVMSRVQRTAIPKHELFRAEGLTIDFTGRIVTVDGVRADLSPKEYDLLFYMVNNRNIALTREMLITNVWGYDFYGDDRTLDTHIKLLRRSLGPYSKFIVTLRGVGYRFETHGA